MNAYDEGETRGAAPPTSEQALLGAVLCGYPDFPDLLPVITGKDFTSPAHEVIWNAIVAVYQAGGTPDPFPVRDSLGSHTRTLPGGPAYLHTLMETAVMPASAPWYAQQVASESRTRLVRSTGTKLAQLSEDTDPDAALEQARQVLDLAAAGRRASGPVRLVDVLPDVITASETKADAGWSTPWVDLDRIIGGMKRGRLVVVAARPGVGKSLALTNLAAWHAKTHGRGAYLGSLEMGRREVTSRILASDARINLTNIERGTLTDTELISVNDAWRRWDTWPLHIEDDSHQTVATTRTNVRELKRNGVDISLVCLDYLQLMKATDTRLPREQQVSAMTRELKIFARELDVCVVLASQLNRNSLARADGRPNLGDLRESGAIEQDADLVILMHRPDEGMPEIEVHVAKQRNGPLGTATLLVQGYHARLTSSARSY